MTSWPHLILVSSQRPYLLISSPSGLVFRHMNLGDLDHRLKALQPSSLPSLFWDDYRHWHLYTKHTRCFVYTANKAHISRSGLGELHAQILDIASSHFHPKWKSYPFPAFLYLRFLCLPSWVTLFYASQKPGSHFWLFLFLTYHIQFITKTCQ